MFSKISINLSLIGIVLFLAALIGGCAHNGSGMKAASDNPVRILEKIDITDFPSTDEAEKHFDLVVFLPEHANLKWDTVLAELQNARAVFLNQGIDLNLIEANRIRMPKQWYSVTSHVVPEESEEFDKIDFYERFVTHPKELPDKTKRIFSSIIGQRSDSDRTVYLIILNELIYPYYERDESGESQLIRLKVSGVSFPSYIYQDRIPRDYRGVIALAKSKGKKRVLAHELGHKLINVSHEGKSYCPQFSGKGIPGLMGYAGQTEIYSNESGRWHSERLNLSPYIYRRAGEKKVWNPDYVHTGGYRDKIYGKFYLTPACPEKK